MSTIPKDLAAGLMGNIVDGIQRPLRVSVNHSRHCHLRMLMY